MWVSGKVILLKGTPSRGTGWLEKFRTEPSADCMGFASSSCANCAKKMYALTSPCAKPVRVLKYNCSNTAAEMVFTAGHLQQECFSFLVQSLLVYMHAKRSFSPCQRSMDYINTKKQNNPSCTSRSDERIQWRWITLQTGVWCTQNMHWNGSSLMWYCFRWYPKTRCIKLQSLSHSFFWLEYSESARKQRRMISQSSTVVVKGLMNVKGLTNCFEITCSAVFVSIYMHFLFLPCAWLSTKKKKLEHGWMILAGQRNYSFFFLFHFQIQDQYAHSVTILNTELETLQSDLRWGCMFTVVSLHVYNGTPAWKTAATKMSLQKPSVWRPLFLKPVPLYFCACWKNSTIWRPCMIL